MVGRCNLPFGMAYFQWLCYVLGSVWTQLSQHVCHMFFGVDHIRPWMPPIKAKENEIGSFGFGDLRFGKDGQWTKTWSFAVYFLPSYMWGWYFTFRFGSLFFFVSVWSLWGGWMCCNFFGKFFFCQLTWLFHQFFCVCGGTFEPHMPPLCPRNFMRGLSTKQGPIYFDLFKVMLCFL